MDVWRGSTSGRSAGTWLAAVVVATALSLSTAPGAGAAGDGNGSSALDPTRAEDPDYTAGVRAIKAGEYTKAIGYLEQVVARDPRRADAYNWLAYAIRKNGDPAASIPIYEKALAIDPAHRGAHEYIGEAYLALDNLPKAREHLARLNSLCFFPCAEYRDLKKALEAYEASGGRVRPASGR